MVERGRGAKTNTTKNYRAHEEWMTKKKLGRPKQTWTGSRWEKVN